MTRSLHKILIFKTSPLLIEVNTIKNFYSIYVVNVRYMSCEILINDFILGD